MADTLTPEQVLLLENLTYFSGPDGESLFRPGVDGMTVGEFLNTIDINNLNPNTEYSTLVYGNEWQQMLTAVQNDPTLSNMVIHEPYTDRGPGGGGGQSVVFTNDTTMEAVVAFRGTSNNEWADDFIGGGPTSALDGVSTPQQENALDYYRSVYESCGLEDYFVTVTGHSKGGNKAKYITILDETVDRCISFDGQGYSDEFIDYYSDEIRNRQDLIDNYNLDGDFVNILLNDVGREHYCEGFGVDSFFENHCANSFFEFDENGVPHINVDNNQSEAMIALDDFLNSYLRSMDPSDRADALALIGSLAEDYFNNVPVDDIINTLLDPNNAEVASDLIAFIIEYERSHPELADDLRDLLNDLGYGDFAEYIDAIQFVLDSDFLIGLITNGLDFLGDIQWVRDKIREALEEQGIHLTDEQIDRISDMIGRIDDNLDDVEAPNGSDRRVGEPNFFERIRDRINEWRLSAFGRDFRVDPDKLTQYADEMGQCSESLSANRGIFEPIDHLGLSGMRINMVLAGLERSVYHEERGIKNLAYALSRIGERYAEAENNIING